MDDLDGWARTLAATVSEGVRQPQRICELCVDVLDITGAGISIVTSAGNRGAVCSTDDTSACIEELQLTLGEGPCIDAVHSGTPVLIDDLGSSDDLAVERWPAFIKGADEAGVRAVFAFPIRIGAVSIGALDLYRDRPGELRTTDLSAALMAADAASMSLINLDAAEIDLVPAELETNSPFQRQVHQATGMIQVQLGVTTEEAFLALRARAFASSRPLADVASDVVARTVRFTPEDS